ncbi:putative bifunctional diguanylate cyclase/phosphodiesterase [Sphingobium sp. B12D2B]|uniref:putative bifunctional diguanylate cyclase/phosphodiesterase n=1 Tax=Sphingobium sp. B12D2B TaxID=2940577 RepID=UPI002224A9A1|nr:bifunctional diguanylate cyclase/phosphodiesterase [Sphingobium sp. B12D2B]MCW2348691.1 diguanylate cyclase (GGDEF)-like protein [Sphingobium sp. B12D2B]
MTAPLPAIDDLRGYTAFLKALPYPAALLTQSPSGLHVLVGNAEFFSFVEDQAANELLDCEDSQRRQRNWRHRAQAMFDSQRRSDRFELEFHDRLGLRAYSCSLTWVEEDDAQPARLVLFTATDRTSERNAESTLRKELMTDSLTSLPNRIGFVEQIEGLAENGRPAASKATYAIIGFDLVRFSRINESLGAMAGDELIITVARRVKSVLRAGDVLARIGGNEFAIFAHVGHGLSEVLQIAERVRKAFEAPIRLSTYLINVEVALGCALAQEDSDDIERLLRQAQAAVKRAKKSGALEVYRANVLREALKRFTLENRLREAIDNGELTMVFQPLINLQTGAVKGFEALTRWEDSVLGQVSPNEFIPVAEESGLIVPLGRWAMCECVQTLADWDRRFGETLPITMNVNLSPVQMVRDNVPRAVEEALRYAGIAGNRLIIELTESALIADPDKTRQLLGALQAMDVTVAMDDFGTGFSNLASLQSLPIDVLKIDRSFVTDMIGDADKIAIVRAIVSLAGALGMETTAEGIETPDMADALRKLGCHFGQGYHFARPLPPQEAFHYWLERSAAPTI